MPEPLNLNPIQPLSTPGDSRIPAGLKKSSGPSFAEILKNSIKEVLIATTSDTEGEATAMHLAKVFKPLSVKISRLAQGIPLGSGLEFTDRATLMHAIEARNEIKT